MMCSVQANVTTKKIEINTEKESEKENQGKKKIEKKSEATEAPTHSQCQPDERSTLRPTTALSGGGTQPYFVYALCCVAMGHHPLYRDDPIAQLRGWCIRASSGLSLRICLRNMVLGRGVPQVEMKMCCTSFSIVHPKARQHEYCRTETPRTSPDLGPNQVEDKIYFKKKGGEMLFLLSLSFFYRYRICPVCSPGGGVT